MTEHDHQVAFFDWSRLQSKVHHELRWMYAVPNAGKRSRIGGVWCRAEGLKKGVWDIHLPVPRNGKPGMWIEFKSETGRLSKEQAEFGEAMKRAGYVCIVARDWYKAAAEVMSYLTQREAA